MGTRCQKAAIKPSSTAKLLALSAFVALLFLNLGPGIWPGGAAAESEPPFPESAPTFVDPTAAVSANVKLGNLVYVAPFAEIKAGSGADKSIRIGDQSNVQDNCAVSAEGGMVRLGDNVIVAHGAAVKGPASIGVNGHCPAPGSCPSFVGFNAEVDGAIIEKDAMVSSLARVGPGVTIPSGYKVLPGKNVTSEADVRTKTDRVTPDDRKFMHDVIQVNVAFARGYSALAARAPSDVRGINLNPPTSFNPQSELPMLHGKRVSEPGFKDRVIGDLHLVDSLDQLRKVVASRTSLRADEGEPFDVAAIAEMKDSVTFHALEHTHIRLGRNGHYGRGSIVHGGPTPFDNYTITGDNFQLGDLSVFFRSRIGDNSRIGYKCLVQECDLPANTVIPDRTARIGDQTSRVEW